MSVLTMGGRRSVKLSRSASSGWWLSPDDDDDVVVVVETGVRGVASMVSAVPNKQLERMRKGWRYNWVSCVVDGDI